MPGAWKMLHDLARYAHTCLTEMGVKYNNVESCEYYGYELELQAGNGMDVITISIEEEKGTLEEIKRTHIYPACFQMANHLQDKYTEDATNYIFLMDFKKLEVTVTIDGLSIKLRKYYDTEKCCNILQLMVGVNG